MLMLGWTIIHITIDLLTEYLRHCKGNLNEYWRYRIGKYRIITSIYDDKIIINIISVGNRSNIYK